MTETANFKTGMSDKRQTNNTNRLPKTVKRAKTELADTDVVCIPKKTYLEMLRLIQGMTNNGGRAKHLLAELPKV